MATYDASQPLWKRNRESTLDLPLVRLLVAGYPCKTGSLRPHRPFTPFVRRAMQVSLLIAAVGASTAAHCGESVAAEGRLWGAFDVAQAQDAKAYLDRGIEKAKQGDLDGALSELNEAIRLDPQSAFAYYNRGVIWGARQNLDRAISEYDQAIKFEPKYAVAYVNRGLAWHNKGNSDRALADFDKAIALKPEPGIGALAYLNRGLVKVNTDVDTAIADYSRAIELNPNIAQAYSNRGEAYRLKRDFDRATGDLDHAIRLNRISDRPTTTADWCSRTRAIPIGLLPTSTRQSR